MTFKTIYEISILNSTVQEGFAFLLIGGLAGGIGLKTATRLKRVLCLMWALVWCGACGLWFIGSIAGSYQYVQMLRDQKASVVEGVVRVEHVQPPEGRDSGDRVRIGDKIFDINFYDTKAGYTKTISHGGDLKDGVYARVYYHNDDIIKIEIAWP